MSSQITILSYQNYQSLNHLNDYVVIYFKIDGGGTFVRVNNYCCFSLFNDVWNPMTKKDSSLNTIEPISVRGTKYCTFVWDASSDGVAILNQNQRFQFSLYYRDIMCNTSSSSTPSTQLPPGRIVDPPRITTTFRPIPVSRIPGRPNDPTNPGLGQQQSATNNAGIENSIVIQRSNGVVVNNTPPTRQRPLLNYDYLPLGTSGPEVNPNQVQTRLAGQNIVRPGEAFINEISNTELALLNGFTQVIAGQGINTNVGTLIVGIGDNSSSQNVNTEPDIESAREYNTSIEINPTISVGREEAEFSSTSSALESINPTALPIFNKKGDPSPYIPKGNQFNDVLGLREYLNTAAENFNHYDGFNKSQIYIPDLIKVNKLPSFDFENFSREFIAPSLFITPREIAVGETLTIAAQFLNSHESISHYAKVVLYLKSPSNELFELQRTDFAYIQPDNIIGCGLTINTIGLTSLGRWNIYAFLIGNNNNTLTYATEFFNLNNSNSYDGINTQSLGITRSSNRNRQNDLVITSDRLPTNPIQDIPGNIITSQNIATSVLLNLIFNRSNPTKIVVLLQSGNNVSVTVIATNNALFRTQLSDGSVVISSGYGQVFPYLNNVLYEYSQEDLSILEDPNTPINNGGIVRSQTSTSTLYVTLTPDIHTTLASVLFGGQGISIRPASASVVNLSINSWTINLTLPVGNEQYRYGYIGMNSLRIPSSTVWTDFTSDANGLATIPFSGYSGGYISILRIGVDETFRPIRDEILKVRLV